MHVEVRREVRTRIVRELQIMHECNSPYIVSFYGAFMNDAGDVVMCMEYMDVGYTFTVIRRVRGTHAKDATDHLTAYLRILVRSGSTFSGR